MSAVNRTGDQADTLRQMARTAKKNEQAGTDAARIAGGQGIRVIAVTSGKGGVGKSNVVANLAMALAAKGKRILIIDADLGVGNMDVLLGLSPQYNLNHVLSGEKMLSEIIIDVTPNIKLIPAGSGVQEYTSLGQHEKMKLLDELDMLDEAFDIMFIDTEAGISENVTYFTVAAQEILVVVTPEPTSITDAYALIKLLATRYSEHHFKVLVNMARDSEDALEVFRKLANVAGRFLDISLDYLGCVVRDERLIDAVKKQKAVFELHADSDAANCFATLASRVLENSRQARLKGNIQFFFRRYLEGPGTGGL
ncbi:MinD/ParA family protein [Trichlorobacter ammonificans]|uniref:Antiactivator FleN n=1 Tax=Trichlorobacter ammonificans TaxID=2916410 RepID=A0ABM9D429_9BACT|nr:MinD/ParA family protein [Trichlorobacter ammonificans]CAH2030006.1 Antiactivator FleN [Trichlorobacter ammonificans]